jgi:site-specific DNA recombinase
MRAAIYARVSTERQERQQTIDSQLAALRAWAEAQGHSLVEQHVFRDEGYSGSRLDRPGLDGLRDAVRDAAIDVVAVLSPDRLARKYAYQVLLLEEFRRAGCEVAFLHRPISDDPNDQLLLQIQGAIAEYERAVLAERFRRGKLQKARDGHIPSAKAPYGYRYEPRRDAVPARLVVDEAEADMVRQLHAWVMEEGLTVRQCVKRLNAGPWVTRSGRQQWAPSVVHHVLSDPVYTGTAYANRFEYVVPKKARRRSPRSGERTSRRPRPPEQWIAVPVPALIDQQAWDSVQDRLARNAATSFRHSKRHDYLLRCLLKCGTCGLGVHGCYFPGHQGRRGRRYYRCAGTSPLTSGRESKCPQARIEADVLERVVWDHVVGLLSDPVQLRTQFERFLAEGAATDLREELPGRRLRARLDRLDRADRRLLEAYQAEVISLEELSRQRRALAEQRRITEQHHEQHRRLRERRVHADEALASLSGFCDRIRSRLDTASIAERQAILQLVVERIIVRDGNLEIQHVIPLRDPRPGTGTSPPAGFGLRSDGVRPAEGQADRPRRAVLQQALEPRVAVHLQHAREPGQVGGRMLALAVLGVEEDHRRRGAPAPRPVVDGVAPQPPGLGPAPAGVEHRQRGVVDEDPGRAHDVPAQLPPQRLEPPASPSDPVAQGGAVQRDALAREDRRLTVERQEIAVLGHQHVRQQGLGGHPAGDRPLRGGRLHDRPLARAAAVARAADHPHPQHGGDDVEHLARVLADDVHGPAAARAGLVLEVDQDLDPRQVRRQGAQVAPARPRRPRGAAPRGHLLLRRLGRRGGLLEVLQAELELVGVELLRAPAEPVALQLPDQQPQLLDLGRRGVALRTSCVSRNCSSPV